MRGKAMFCTECGTQLADDVRFCTHCGATLGVAVAAPKAVPDAPEPTRPGITEAKRSAALRPSPRQTELGHPLGARRGILIGVVAGVLVAVGLVIGWWTISRPRSPAVATGIWVPLRPLPIALVPGAPRVMRMNVTREQRDGGLQGKLVLQVGDIPVSGRVRGDHLSIHANITAPRAPAPTFRMVLEGTVRGRILRGTLTETVTGPAPRTVTHRIVMRLTPSAPIGIARAPASPLRTTRSSNPPAVASAPPRSSGSGLLPVVKVNPRMSVPVRPGAPPGTNSRSHRKYLRHKEQELQRLLN